MIKLIKIVILILFFIFINQNVNCEIESSLIFPNKQASKSEKLSSVFVEDDVNIISNNDSPKINETLLELPEVINLPRDNESTGQLNIGKIKLSNDKFENNKKNVTGKVIDANSNVSDKPLYEDDDEEDFDDEEIGKKINELTKEDSPYNAPIYSNSQPIDPETNEPLKKPGNDLNKKLSEPSFTIDDDNLYNQYTTVQPIDENDDSNQKSSKPPKDDFKGVASFTFDEDNSNNQDAKVQPIDENINLNQKPSKDDFKGTASFTFDEDNSNNQDAKVQPIDENNLDQKASIEDSKGTTSFTFDEDNSSKQDPTVQPINENINLNQKKPKDDFKGVASFTFDEDNSTKQDVTVRPIDENNLNQKPSKDDFKSAVSFTLDENDSHNQDVTVRPIEESGDFKGLASFTFDEDNSNNQDVKDEKIINNQGVKDEKIINNQDYQLNDEYLKSNVNNNVPNYNQQQTDYLPDSEQNANKELSYEEIPTTYLPIGNNQEELIDEPSYIDSKEKIPSSDSKETIPNNDPKETISSVDSKEMISNNDQNETIPYKDEFDLDDHIAIDLIKYDSNNLDLHGASEKEEIETELLYPSVYKLFKLKMLNPKQQATTVNNPEIGLNTNHFEAQKATLSPVRSKTSKIINPSAKFVMKQSGSFPATDLFRRTCAIKINSLSAVGKCRTSCGPKEIGIQLKFKETCTSHQLICNSPFESCCIPNLNEQATCDIDLFKQIDVLSNVEKSLNLPQNSLIKLSHFQPAFLESVINYRPLPVIYRIQNRIKDNLLHFHNPNLQIGEVPRPSILHVKKTNATKSNDRELKSLKADQNDQNDLINLSNYDSQFKTISNQPISRRAQLRFAKVLRKIENPKPNFRKVYHHVPHDLNHFDLN